MLGKPVINRPYLNSVTPQRRTPNSVFKDCKLDLHLMSSYTKEKIEFQENAAGLVPHEVKPKQIFKEDQQMSHFCIVQRNQFKEPQLFKKFMVANNLHDVL